MHSLTRHLCSFHRIVIRSNLWHSPPFLSVVRLSYVALTADDRKRQREREMERVGARVFALSEIFEMVNVSSRTLEQLVAIYARHTTPTR